MDWKLLIAIAVLAIVFFCRKKPRFSMRTYLQQEGKIRIPKTKTLGLQ